MNLSCADQYISREACPGAVPERYENCREQAAPHRRRHRGLDYPGHLVAGAGYRHHAAAALHFVAVPPRHSRVGQHSEDRPRGNRVPLRHAPVRRRRSVRRGWTAGNLKIRRVQLDLVFSYEHHVY